MPASPPPGSASNEIWHHSPRSQAIADRDRPLYASPPVRLNGKKRVAHSRTANPDASRNFTALEAFFFARESRPTSPNMENGDRHLPSVVVPTIIDAGSHPSRHLFRSLEFRTVQSPLQCLCGGALWNLGGHWPPNHPVLLHRIGCRAGESKTPE